VPELRSLTDNAGSSSTSRAYPDDGSGTELHLVMDNFATRKRKEVCDWLAANPRIKAHFTPTSASWMNRRNEGQEGFGAVTVPSQAAYRDLT